MNTPKVVYEPSFERTNPQSSARGPFALYSDDHLDWTLTRDEAVALMESIRHALQIAGSTPPATV